MRIELDPESAINPLLSLVGETVVVNTNDQEFNGRLIGIVIQAPQSLELLSTNKRNDGFDVLNIELFEILTIGMFSHKT